MKLTAPARIMKKKCDSDSKTYRVITTQHERPNNDNTTPTVRIFKINGCAGKLKKLGRKEDSDDIKYLTDEILITESDLQSIKVDNWKYFLAGDRIGSHSFLFSGFSAEEPQIRHLSLQISNELLKCEHRCDEDEAIDLGNAPFIQEYNCTLSFPQLQIMTAFLNANTKHSHRPIKGQTNIDPIFRNVFCGTSPDTPLSPSEFMATLYFYVYRQAIIKKSLSERTIKEYFRNLSIDLHQWTKRLTSPDEKMLKRLLLPPEDNDGPKGDDGPILLSRILYSVHHPKSCIPNEWYLPMHDEPLLIVLVLLVLFSLGLPSSRSLKTAKITEFFLKRQTTLRLSLISNNSIDLFCNTAVAKRQNRPQKNLLVLPQMPFDIEMGRWSDIKEDRGVYYLQSNTAKLVSLHYILNKAQEPDHLVTLIVDRFLLDEKQSKAQKRLDQSTGHRND